MSKINKKSEIVHIITGLTDGGAEGVLYRLISNTLTENHTVICLCRSEKYESKLRDLDVPVHVLSLHKIRYVCSGILKLISLLNQKNRDTTIIQTWMYHSDFIGGLAARALRHRKILWGIRQTKVHHGRITTRIIAKICAYLSKYVPSAIISCSQSAKLYHQRFGYRGNFHVIPNGYSMENFYPSKQLREVTRETLTINQDNLLVLGCVASWKPFKDHNTLLSGIALWSRRNPDVDFRLLLVGKGCDKNNEKLTEMIAKHRLQSSVILLGTQTNICAIMNAIDLHVLASNSEGFPNAVAEAMACGTPCLTTDVGEAAEIVGATGWVVQPQSETSFANGLTKAVTAISNKPDNISLLCRERVETEFPLHKMVDSFSRVWQQTLQ